MDGAFAVCILVTLGFGAFIVWGRSASGRQALRQTLGEPTPRLRTPRRIATKSSASAAVKKPSNRPASPPSSALKSPRASSPASQKTASQKPTDRPPTGSTSRSRKP